MCHASLRIRCVLPLNNVPKNHKWVIDKKRCLYVLTSLPKPLCTLYTSYYVYCHLDERMVSVLKQIKLGCSGL